MSKSTGKGSSGKNQPAVWTLVLAGLVAGAILIGIAVVGSGGKDEPSAPTAGDIFEPIAQDGIYAGDKDAPVTLVEFADMQCPFCGEFAVGVIPGIVKEFVATGKLRLEFRPLTFVGEDSERAARAVAGAARQNKLWSFVHEFYERQEDENSGYVTDDFLKTVANASGVSFDKMIQAQTDPLINELTTDSSKLAEKNRISSTPSFLIRRGDVTERFDPGSIEPEKFLDALRSELKK